MNLPYSRKRRYLTGMDWIIGALDHRTRRNYRVGGSSQAVIDLDGFLDEQKLAEVLRQIARRLPLLHGEVSRDWLNLAPCWKIPLGGGDLEIPLRTVDLAAGESDRADELFVEHFNRPAVDGRQHLRFLLVRLGRQRSRLGMIFDHLMLDAFGAVVFLRLIDHAAAGQLDQIAPLVQQTEPAHLDRWVHRLRMGRRLNRLLVQMYRNKPVRALAMPPGGRRRPIRFVHDSLTREESDNFNRRAGAEIGVPIILPSATARAILAMRQSFPTMPLAGRQDLVVTSGNLRPPGKDWELLFGNHFSLVPFSLPIDAGSSVEEAAIFLRDQFFQRMKQQLPLMVQDASTLARICPHPIGSRLFQLLGKGRICSFYFVCVREGKNDPDRFMGLPITRMIHMPLVFSPPGLNICMTGFGGKFDLVISYLDGVIDDAQARRLMGQFKSLLLQ